METIYLDELFLLNLIIDYFLLLGTARVCGLPFHRLRFAAGAAFGSLWCCLGILPGLSFLQSALLHPVLAAAMILASFGGEVRLARCFLAFLGLSALFGGAVYAACLYQGSENSGGLIHLDMRVLVISFALCWALISFVFRRSLKNAERRIHTVTMEKNGRSVNFQALEDTGNGLYDPLSGCPALVAEAKAVEPLFAKSEAALLRGPPVEAVEKISGLRLIPYAGVGGNGGMLLAFRPDCVTVDGTERRELIAAITPAAIGTDGSYQAVI